MVWCLWYIDAYQDIYKYIFASFITEAPDKIQTVHRIHWEHLVEACGLSLRLGEALNLWIELKRSRSQRGFLGHPSMARVFSTAGSVCPFRWRQVSGITSAFQQASHGGNLLAIIQFEAYQYNSQPPSSEQLSNRPVKGGVPPKKEVSVLKTC